MNSRKRTRTSLHNSQNAEDISTPKNETKHNLLTSCRRVGLNRKKNKSLDSSQISKDTLVTSTFVEEDLKKITAIDTSNTNSDIGKEKSLLISSILDCDDNSSDTIKPNIKKPRVVSSRKRKLVKDSSKSKEFTNVDKPSINDTLQSSCVVDSSSNSQNSNEIPDSNKNKSESSTELTIPVSINLTRCDLNALKLKLLSPKKSKIDETTETSTENKENQPAAENTKISDHLEDNNSKVESTKSIEENIDKQQDKTTPESSLLVPNETVSIENNSLEENSDGSDFYPEVVRRKKKRVLTNKQRNISKPSPSQQKENITSKRTSANNTPCYSDSDDDFQATPVRRDRKSSQKSENSQNSEKDEKVKKKKLKMKKPIEDELVKTGHIRLSENKSYTIIQRDNYVSYVKSFDNDVNFKVTESDDNQQLPVRNSVNSPKKTMIVERKDYITKRRSSLSKNIEMLMEMPSIFADINDVASTTEEFQNKPNEENKKPKSSKTVDRISVVKTSKLQNIPKTLTNQTNELETDMKNKHIISDQQKDLCTYENKQRVSQSENIQKSAIITTTSEQCIDEIISENPKIISEEQENKSTSENFKSEKTNVSGPSGLKKDKLPEKPSNATVAEIVEEFNTDSSENEESSDLPESEDDNISTSSKSDDTISKLQLQNEELQNMTVKQLTDELSLLENTVKKKEERLQSLKRISIYKETHNLEQLRQVTLQTKRGSQSALIDLVLSLKEQSSADFTMSTLLEFMKIPNELVGYNEQEDKFI